MDKIKEDEQEAAPRFVKQKSNSPDGYENKICFRVLEGVKIVFKVGLALSKHSHDDLVKLPFEKLMLALRNFPEESMNPDFLLPMAYSIKVSKRLEELKEEYEKEHGKLSERVKQKMLQPP